MTELIDIFARGGGGGSGGGGGGGGIIVLPFILISMYISWRIRKKIIAKARAGQEKALETDKTWQDDVILPRAETIFRTFQKDWSNFNVENMSTYMTKRYYDHVFLMLAAMHQMHRRNDVKNVNLNSVTLFGVNDQADNELDTFNVEIRASVTDYLIDERTKENLMLEDTSFTEIWHFEREGSQWQLDGITQINNDRLITNYRPVIDVKYRQFADKNKFFYNADFGWLLLPTEGVLFSESRLGRSDINHHVLGVHHDRVIQLFEYLPIIKNKISLKDHLTHWRIKKTKLATYTVAQVTLPKTYGNIIVERTNVFNFFEFTPPNMTKVNLEWPEFNKLFNVYATDMERVTSLELLHPVFMTILADLKFRVSLEIINDNLYLYSTDKSADYDIMLAILQDAFKEMKM